MAQLEAPNKTAFEFNVMPIKTGVFHKQKYGEGALIFCKTHFVKKSLSTILTSAA